MKKVTMSLICRKQSWYGLVTACSLVLILTGCGEKRPQAAIIWKWQAVAVSFNGTTIPIPADQISLDIQFFEESAVHVIFTDNTTTPAGIYTSLTGIGTYTFIDDTNIVIEMPPEAHGFQALNTFAVTLLASKGNRILSTAHPTALPEGLNSASTPLNGLPPVFNTDITSRIYEVHISGDQLTMKDKDGVTITYKKWVY